MDYLDNKQNDSLTNTIIDDPENPGINFLECLDNEDDIKDDDYLSLIPKLSRIVLYLGNSLKDEEWMRQKVKSDFHINYFVPSVALKEPFKFMSARIIESNEALNDYLDNSIFEIKKACQELCESLTEDSDLTNIIKDLANEDSLTTRLKTKTIVETLYAGRIRYEIKNGKLNYQNIYLETSFSLNRGEVVPLDLSSFKNSENKNGKLNFSLFPGKIVILKGQNFNGDYINVSTFIEFDKILKPDFPLKCPPVLLEQGTFNIICACGPFIKVDDSNIDITNTKYLKAIADYLNHYNPDILFLLGPFFDETMYDLIQKWSLRDLSNETNVYPYQWNLDKLFNHQIRFLCKELEGRAIHTRIIIIPSSNEIGKANIYPMFPVEVKSNIKIQSFSNPSLLNIGGISIGLTSTDILLHMSRKEIHNIDLNKTKNTERLKRLCGHILSHRHFYPLLPPDMSLNMEYQMYNYLTMPITPHLLILPSVLRPFAYNINETIVVNPGKVSKNTIARVMFESLKDESYYSGSLSQYTNVEIIKLIQ